MDLWQEIQSQREEILQIAAKHGAVNLRVFGSVARGESRADSDLDLLVDAAPVTSAWFPGSFIADLEELLKRKVDVATPAALHWYIKDQILREARPL